MGDYPVGFDIPASVNAGQVDWSSVHPDFLIVTAGAVDDNMQATINDNAAALIQKAYDLGIPCGLKIVQNPEACWSSMNLDAYKLLGENDPEIVLLKHFYNNAVQFVQITARADSRNIPVAWRYTTIGRLYNRVEQYFKRTAILAAPGGYLETYCRDAQFDPVTLVKDMDVMASNWGLIPERVGDKAPLMHQYQQANAGGVVVKFVQWLGDFQSMYDWMGYKKTPPVVTPPPDEPTEPTPDLSAVITRLDNLQAGVDRITAWLEGFGK